MSKYPAIAYKEAVQVAKALGFMKRSHRKTSHVQYKHPVSGKKVPIPNYGKENYGPDLLANICRGLGVTKKEFYKVLTKKA